MIQWQQLLSIGLLFLSACAPASTSAPTQTAVSIPSPSIPVEATATEPMPTISPSPSPVSETSSPSASTPTARTTATEPKSTIIPSPIPVTATPTPTQPTASPTMVAWKTHSGQGFALDYPGDWGFVGPDGIECTGLYHFFPSSLELISFSACWEDHVGGNMLSFAETYDRFREGFIDDALISANLINGIEVEIIQYTSIKDNGIYLLTAPQGTVALWQNEGRGWALIDEENQNQENGRFDRILMSFNFHGNQ